jgi:hypothetical protein
MFAWLKGLFRKEKPILKEKDGTVVQSAKISRAKKPKLENPLPALHYQVRFLCDHPALFVPPLRASLPYRHVENGIVIQKPCRFCRPNGLKHRWFSNRLPNGATKVNISL